MDKIKIMVSSRVEELAAERDAILGLYQNHPMIEIVGAAPYASSSASSSSALETQRLARECDLYILLLGKSFGFEYTDGRSATEIEYDAAYKDDPTKILVFLKETEEEPDEKQAAFIKKVCDYYNGYWRTTFKYSHTLAKMVEESVLTWIRDRASLGKKVSYCEHFIRQAIQLKPTSDTQVYYRVTTEYVELEYKYMKFSNVQHFERKSVFSNFWGCLNEVQVRIEGWCSEWSQ